MSEEKWMVNRILQINEVHIKYWIVLWCRDARGFVIGESVRGGGDKWIWQFSRCRWPFCRCAKCVRVESGWLFMLTRMYHLQIQTCTATGMNWTTHGRQPQTNCHIIWSILYPPIKLLWLFKFNENEIEVIRKSMVSRMHWFRITTINHLAGDRPSVHMVMWIRHTNITFTFTHHVWHNS